MRRAVLLLLAAATVLLGTGPAPASAAGRLDTVAQALRTDPVFVSIDMQDAFPPALARATRERIAQLDPPFRLLVAVLPLLNEDESGGDADRVLYGLADRLGPEPTVLVLVSQRGVVDVLPSRVDRDVELDFDLRYGPSSRESLDQLRIRLDRVIQQVAAAARGETFGLSRPDGPVDPVFSLLPDDEEEDGDGAGWEVMVILWGSGALLGAASWVVRRPKPVRRPAAGGGRGRKGRS